MSRPGSAPLADLLIERTVSYGIVQPGIHEENGVPIVRVKDIRNGTIAAHAPLRVSAEIANPYDRTQLSGGELLVSLVGTVGETAVVPKELAGWNVARAVAVVRPEGVTSNWLHYAFLTPEVREQVIAALNTTVQSTLNLSDLKRVLVPVADERSMTSITEVLGALDDKIAANAELARTADDLAITLCSRAISAVPLSELCDVARQTVDPSALGVELVEHFSLPAFDASRRPEAVPPSRIKSAKSLVSEPSVLLSKLNPRFPRVWDVPRLPEAPSVASTEFVVLRPRYSSTSVLSALLLQSEFRSALEGKVSGTSGSHQRVKPADLLATPVLDPRQLTDAVLSAVTACGVRAVQAREESAALAELRDTLLPHLMSGRLRVRDAEKAVSDAV